MKVMIGVYIPESWKDLLKEQAISRSKYTGKSVSIADMVTESLSKTLNLPIPEKSTKGKPARY